MASGDVDFSKYKVENLKKYLSDRGIQSSDRGKGNRRAELLELCQNAAEMRQQKLEEVVESFDRVLEEKLQTNEGLFPNPIHCVLGLTILQVYPNSHLPTCTAT